MDKIKFGLNGNKLKIIGAVSMTADHIGYMLLPDEVILRAVGRLAFPLFAYFIYQGSIYTRNKLKYFLQISGIGLLCILGYYVYCREVYINALITFSMSVCILYCIQFFKERLKQNNILGCLTGAAGTFLFIGLSYFVCSCIDVDYGFQGVMLPVFAEISASFCRSSVKETVIKFSLVGFALGLIWLSYRFGGLQYICLFSLPFLFLYNGSRGSLNMKSFFYWFYPLHFLLIGGADCIINFLK
ncbi:MAG: conjugal transfer protein TraX [Clostridiales bacterium]|nr:conjugal transfer protein TraX [Clostridiales bacterium]